jgi:FkbM family methyltransferase
MPSSRSVLMKTNSTSRSGIIIKSLFNRFKTAICSRVETFWASFKNKQSLYPLQLSNTLKQQILPNQVNDPSISIVIKTNGAFSKSSIELLETAEQMRAKGASADACQQYLSAIGAGCDDWRVGLALASAAKPLRNLDLIESACAAIRKAHPSFGFASEFPKHCRGYYSQVGQDKIIESYFLKNPPREKFFVEVGAFDGVHYSNVRRLHETYGWKGLSIEPVKQNFEKLRKSYENTGVICEFAAVSSREYEAEINVASYVDFPEWGSDIARLDQKDATASTGSIRWEKQKVMAMPLTRILEKHGIRAFSFLSIDAEGHDLEVLHSLDTKIFRPEMIVVEYIGQRRGILDWAEANRYQVRYDNGMDWFLVPATDEN